MRRLAAIAVFALLVAVPVWAQHGGGGHGGGGFSGHGGFGGHAGGAAHFSGGMHSAAPASHGFNHSATFAQGGFSHRGISQGRFGSRGPFLHDGFRGRHFGFRNCFGYRCGTGYYPWYPWGYYDPWWWDNGSSYDEDYDRDRENADEMNTQNLEQQRMLDQEERDHDQDLYARSAPPAPAPQAAPESVQPPTVLVFRDQHQKEVRNYAIVGHTLWNFAPQKTEKIPLTDLDLTATAKANDERGLTFHVPSSAQAQ